MKRRPAPGNVSRRHFLASGAGTGLGLALGVAPLLPGCGDSDDGAPGPHTHQRTLFFNLSHEAYVGKTYYLTGGGRRFTLTPCAERPEVLARARLSNAFLRQVPDDQITHHVVDATFSSQSVTLCYVSSDLDVPAGTWSMSSVQLVIPPSGARFAYACARRTTPSGPLPLSAKRRRYGVSAATSAKDLSDERALLDSTSHAATLVGCHPDLMGLDPGVSHAIQSNHIEPIYEIYRLGEALSAAGAATPEQTPGQPNTSGWATLRPVPGTGGLPLKNVHGQHAGRYQYQPDLQPAMHTLAGSCMSGAIQPVKNDPGLGADATGLQPPDGQPLGAVSGAMWLRFDGTTSVDQSSGAAAAADVEMTLTQQNGQPGYQIRASSTQNGDVTQVSLTILNYFLEFRGVWLQFFQDGTLLNLADVPEYVNGTIIAGHDKSSDATTDMFVSMIGPVFTVLAIPIAPGFIQPSFNVPAGATQVRVLSSTLSFQGGNTYSDTVLQGAIMTGVFNYGVTAMLAAAGSGFLIPAMYKAVVVPFLQTLAAELIDIINTALNPNGDPKSLVGLLSTPGFWVNQALVVAKVLVTTVTSKALGELVAFIYAGIGEGTAEDAVPVAGEIMEALSIAVGVLSLGETSAELGLTPWTYIDDLVFTHDLSVTILHDPKDGTFPKAANSYTVTALFDNATPHVQTFALPALVPSTLPPVVFSNVPLGGNVNISVAFVQKATVAGQPDVLLGKGSTGLIANDANAAPSIQITELAFPLSSSTVYQHHQKTTLDASGNHVWTPTPNVPSINATCTGAGTLCSLRGITVRQSTGSARGYLGYAWRAQDSSSNCAAEIDQVAALPTDSNNTQGGYVAGSGCGIIVPGVRVAFSLLSDGKTNFYLDTTNANALMLRQVVLDPPPSIAGPSSNQAWGVLNFLPDALLLHPAGYLVSLSARYHKIETHRIPQAPMADADAKVQLLARVQCGFGTRPGLLNSPVAAAISASGVILVLESGNNRIQALDLGGNPVRHFNKLSGPGTSPYSLTLGGTDSTQGWKYLDLAVEYTGWLYVLSYNQGMSQYRLDLYHPDQSDNQPIATTLGVNAARLTVDLWRNVCTLNYEALSLPGGGPPPSGLTEPSVSQWTPCTQGQTC